MLEEQEFKMDKPFGFSVGNFSIVLKQYNNYSFFTAILLETK